MNSPPPSSMDLSAPVEDAACVSSSPPARPSKPRAKPTITPRSFKRFFTPLPSQSRGSKARAGRNVLGDITKFGTNTLYRVGKQQSSKKGVVRVFDDDENPESGSNNLQSGRKRPLCSPDLSPASSPLKRLKPSDHAPCRQLSWADDSDDQAYDDGDHTTYQDLRPVVRARYRSALGQISRRELDMPSDTYSRSLANYTTDWRPQVANFYTGPEDLHMSRSFVKPGDVALPFCSAACNTNSLVAVGDDEGTVRLLETRKDSKTPLQKPFLSFHPHENALLDLDFSPDDSLLATASGDQTARVIDMPTQRPIYDMKGHWSSVKQVRFQPSSNGSVIATSSRDGSIQLWDLRCKGKASPVIEYKVNLGGAQEDRVDIINGTTPKMAACVAAIPHGHTPAAILATTRNAVSITAISFLGSESDHLLLSGSHADATVKLWDLRTKYYSRTQHPAPLSSTRQPDAHIKHRPFGLTSMSINSSGTRLYTLCKDSTVYAYSIQHLILGSAPELALSFRPKRNGDNKEGLGPLYALRHKNLKASSFYVKSALRTSRSDHGELLAVGSSDACAVLFPTDEKFLRLHNAQESISYASTGLTTPAPTPDSKRLAPSRSSSSYYTDLNSRQLQNGIPTYDIGASLTGAHQTEVTNTAWTSEGELLTLGDDWRVRVWREDANKAHELRSHGDTGGARWGHGWADLGRHQGDYDEDE